MGVVLNRLLSFGNNRRGKIIAWSVIGFTATIFFGGILMAGLGSVTANVSALNLFAPGMEFKTVSAVDGDYPGYYLSASARQTPITAVPDPITTNAPVVFTTTSPLVEFAQNRVAAGGTAILQLKKIGANNMYEFSDPDPLKDVTKIRVDVTCGNQTKVIYVRIVLNPEDAVVTATLESNVRNFPFFWLPAQNLDSRYYDARYQKYYKVIRYRVRMTFKIFGETIYDTGLRREDYTHFRGEEIDKYGRKYGIELSMYEDGGYYVYTDVVPEDIKLNFKIECDFNDNKYFTQTDLLLIIKGWTGEE
jgi:hypothetical protein